MKRDAKYPHLSQKAASFLNLSDEERIDKIRARRWIPYPAANDILNDLEDLLAYPPTHRMPNLLIIGNTNNGKTMLIEHFRKKHPAKDDYMENTVSIPIVGIQAPPTPDESRLYSAILTQLFAPYRQNDRVDKKAAQAIHLLKTVGTKLLVIDEIHSILAGSVAKQRAFLNALRHLGNDLRIPIIALGTQEAYRAIRTDAQLANRFTPVELPLWELDNDYLRLLSSFEVMLPLRRSSNLIQAPLAQKIRELSEGLLGEISTVLVTASVEAIRNGSEKITLELLSHIRFVPPRKRRLGLGASR